MVKELGEDSMMVEEFEFFRKVRASYCNVPFHVVFTYRLSHRHHKMANAKGMFSCSVNAHTQTVEYRMGLKSDAISRPFNESGSFLFTSRYEEIPPQCIVFEDYSIHKQRYKVPIAYDWQAFIKKGAEQAINVGTIQQLFKRWKLKDKEGNDVEANLKVIKVELDG
ncbi:hypothetical protein [Paenibacillus sp. HB172176]|uniref:hypothetical protein n=1 Tax=Paenibacillus sp. HB172176 TaxID=2493690 RepID=UPI001439A586|nr:hypothetical protein [Paenibacillus sp. HB172176]